MIRVGILVFDDVEELDFVGPLEVFGAAAVAGADCEVLTVAPHATAVTCRHGLRMIPGYTFEDVPALDVLIVPGGLGARTHARGNPHILEFVRKHSGFLASVCTGSLILAAAGILDGQEATTHHSAFDALRAFRQIKVREGVRMTIGEHVATSAGVSAGIDLAIALVEKLWGAELARTVSDDLEWTR